MSLALLSDGTVWEWGSGLAGSEEVIPVPVPGLTGVTKISAGSSFNLALRSDGTVWAWGQNDRGQLGNGTTVPAMTPVKVTGLSHVTGIAAGYNAAVATATNGISAATSVWTWGANDHGQLGDGTLADHLTPERITGIGTVYLAGVTAWPVDRRSPGHRRLGLGLGRRLRRPAGQCALQLTRDPAGEHAGGRQRDHPAVRRPRSHARAEVERHRTGLGR